MKNNILLLLFHPRLESSHVNNHVYNVLTKQDIVIKDMYDLYPDFNIDVELEKTDLLNADIIIMQHPMYWYAAPPLYKQWIDLVLEYGWAYGKNGNKLRGKKVFHIVSSGGSYESYCREGKNVYSYHELMRPFELTYKLCHMEYFPPYIIPGANNLDKSNLNEHSFKIQNLITKMMNTLVEDIVTKDLIFLNDIVL
jgi:glutathione-regulated potassium-efflux system ancillary protein KefG